MGLYDSKRELKKIQVDGKVEKCWFISKAKFEAFDANVLGLGDVSQRSTAVEAIAAVFDLSGFTDFCSQTDPQLVVPKYLSQFLDWLFKEVREVTATNKSVRGGRELYSDLPFLAKFLGDGVLFLWDTDQMTKTGKCNVVTILREICNHYNSIFYPKIQKEVPVPPPILRCGIAQGRVFSVGNKQDYVGPCINIAARLQKLSNFTFCFQTKGFDLKRMSEDIMKEYIIKRVKLRGISMYELVAIIEQEFNVLKPKDRAEFKEP